MLFTSLVTFVLLIPTVNSLFIPISKPLSRRKPNKVDIFDKNLAVWWNDKTKKWCATDDMCLHRQGSLSKGIITQQGDIKCGYHGLEYGGCGTCKHMPSSNKPLNLKLDAYDIVEKHGMLWLTDNDPVDTDVVGNMLKTMHRTNWYCVDVDTGTDLLFENSFDSLHFHHVHHQILPVIDRDNPLPVIEEDTCNLKWYNESGFSFTMGNAQFTFIAPYLVTFTINDYFNVCAYILPINENKSKFISNLFLPYVNNLQKYTADNMVELFTPILNAFSHKVFQQDIRQIVPQQEYTNKHGKKYITNYAADKPIQLYNKWVNEYSHVRSSKLTPPPQPLTKPNLDVKRSLSAKILGIDNK